MCTAHPYCHYEVLSTYVNTCRFVQLVPTSLHWTLFKGRASKRQQDCLYGTCQYHQSCISEC